MTGAASEVVNGNVSSYCAVELEAYYASWCSETGAAVWATGSWSDCLALPWTGNTTVGVQTRSVTCGCYSLCDEDTEPISKRSELRFGMAVFCTV